MDIGSIVHILLLILTPLIALFWGVAIVTKKDKLKAHNLMAALLFIFTVAYILFISYFTPIASPVSGVSYMTVSLSIPLIHMLFYKRIIDTNGIRLTDFWMIIPDAILVIGTVLMDIIIGKEGSDLFIQSVVLGKSDVPAQFLTSSWKLLEFFGYYGFRIVLLAEIAYVQIWASVRLTRYNRNLDEYFSDTERRGKKTNVIIFFSTLCALLAALALLAQPFHKIGQNSLLFVSMSIVTSIALFATGYTSYKITFSAEKLTEMLKKDDEKKEEDYIIMPKSDDLAVSEKVYEQCVKGLMKLAMEKEFLKPELSLIDMAMKIGTNRTYLTKVIHAYFNCSFSDYINLLRVEYAERVLQEQQNLTMLEVATASGFSTLSSFYRNFQKFTGTTPAKWLS